MFQLVNIFIKFMTLILCLQEIPGQVWCYMGITTRGTGLMTHCFLTTWMSWFRLVQVMTSKLRLLFCIKWHLFWNHLMNYRIFENFKLIFKSSSIRKFQTHLNRINITSDRFDSWSKSYLILLEIGWKTHSLLATRSHLVYFYFFESEVRFLIVIKYDTLMRLSFSQTFTSQRFF